MHCRMKTKPQLASHHQTQMKPTTVNLLLDQLAIDASALCAKYGSAKVCIRSTAAAAKSPCLHKVQHFSSITWLIWGGGEGGRRERHEDKSAEILFQSFLQESLVSSSGMGRDVHSDVAHPAFPLLTMALPTLQGDLKDGFGEAVVAHEMPK